MELSKQFMFYNFFELIMIKFKKNANFPSLGVITDYKRINKETPTGLALISKGINFVIAFLFFYWSKEIALSIFLF